jgi:hypothetical protein
MYPRIPYEPVADPSRAADLDRFPPDGSRDLSGCQARRLRPSISDRNVN